MSDKQPQISIHDFQTWDFPTLDDTHQNEPPIQNDELHQTNEKTLEPESLIHDESSVITDVLHTITEIAHDNNLVLIENKINYLDNLGQQMAAILSEVDSTLMQSIMELVKKAVKKIILKELSLDEQIIKNMVDESLEKINKDHAACVIQIAEDDYAIFEKKPFSTPVELVIDPELSQGSFIIKTKFSELKAHLDDRLTAIFGL